MHGQVSVGQGLRVADVPAVVLRFDRTGVVAAALDTAEAGASVSCNISKKRFVRKVTNMTGQTD